MASRRTRARRRETRGLERGLLLYLTKGMPWRMERIERRRAGIWRSVPGRARLIKREYERRLRAWADSKIIAVCRGRGATP